MNRLDALRKEMLAKDIDAFLVTSVANVSYISNFSGDASYLLVTAHAAILITDGRYTEQAAAECFSGITLCQWLENKRYGLETFSFLTQQHAIKTMAFEASQITFETYERLHIGLPHVSLTACNGWVENLRKTKDENEVANLRKACAASVIALEKTCPGIKAGMTELELSALLEYNLKTLGGEGLSFDSMALFGERTSLLHGKPGNRKLVKGDLILLDFGALYCGYHADMTRTFTFQTIAPEHETAYNMLLHAQTAAIESLKPNIVGSMPDTVVRQHLTPAYLPYYYPGLGHGVGLQIHEVPFLGATCTDLLLPNMVVTIEPGIYLPGKFGMRIEDTVMITANGKEVLTTFPKTLHIIP